jgi:hypothetical protein
MTIWRLSGKDRQGVWHTLAESDDTDRKYALGRIIIKLEHQRKYIAFRITAHDDIEDEQFQFRDFLNAA